MVIWFAILIGLCLFTMFAFVHAHSKRIAVEDRVASNARVLAEFKRMAIHRPEQIVDRGR